MHFKDRTSFDQWIMEGADYYTACAFRGLPKVFDTHKCDSLEEALAKAEELYTDRPIMIYAVRNGMSAHIRNVEPRYKTLR